MWVRGEATRDSDGNIVGLWGAAQDITDRKQAVEALRHSEEKFRFTFAASPDSVNINRLEDGLYVDINQGFTRLTGFTREDVIGKTSLEIDIWHDPDDRQKLVRGLRAKGFYENLEAQFRCKDGTLVTALMSATVITINNEPHLINITRDITEFKRVQNALRESERHLQKVFDILPVGLWFADKDGTLLKGNPAGIKIWGAQPLVDPSRYGVFKARRFPSGEEIAPTDWSLYHTIKDKATIVDELLEIDAFDGKKKIILNSTAPVLDEQGHVQGAIVVNQDVTERIAGGSRFKAHRMDAFQETPSANEVQAEAHDQGYGDLTELNREGAIIELIGSELLQSVASDYLELLGTSSAIYEASGDYAFGTFASGWCRMMDRASRKLCDTSDNVKALQSGKWLCHESCWTCCAKEAIAKRSPMDIACHGGIRLYGVPILAGGEVAGVINFGYGDPPKDPARLRQLAKAYHLDYDDLIREARAYDSRPPYIIEMAKSRLHASARLIGSILEAKLAEKPGRNYRTN
jgi:PAS domain S-box-containing protein